MYESQFQSVSGNTQWQPDIASIWEPSWLKARFLIAKSKNAWENCSIRIVVKMVRFKKNCVENRTSKFFVVELSGRSEKLVWVEVEG